MAKKKYRVDWNLVAEKYVNEHLGLSELATIFSVDSNLVYYYLKKLGVYKRVNLPLKTIICPACNEEFKPIRISQWFHNRECWLKAIRTGIIKMPRTRTNQVGHYVSEETKKKIGAKSKGRMLGYKHSPESILKMKESAKKRIRPPELLEKLRINMIKNRNMFKKKRLEKHGEAMKLKRGCELKKLKARFCTQCGDPLPRKRLYRDPKPLEFCSQRCRGLYMWKHKSLSKKRTSIEKILSSLLDELGLRHKPQEFLYGKFYVDEFIPEENMVIEAFGHFWHGFPEQQNKDRYREKFLKGKGHKFLILREDDLNEKPEWCKEEIKCLIEKF